MKFIIPGVPIAKKRPRFARMGNFVRTYNDQESEESRWLWEAKRQLGDIQPLEGPIRIEVIFCMPIPKSASRKKNMAMIAGQIHHISRPDVDNMLKFVKDCLNGYAWRDDCQVVSVVAMKQYSAAPRTEIKIVPVGRDEIQAQGLENDDPKSNAMGPPRYENR